jgi:crotonobetainyl-CoA:carnitine CoA-transferase CaiB-like acyl-CoA transferase
VIDLPLLDPLFSFIATEAAIYRLTGTVRERTGSRSETTSPRNVFRTKDGRYIGISARSRRWPSGSFVRSAART